MSALDAAKDSQSVQEMCAISLRRMLCRLQQGPPGDHMDVTVVRALHHSSTSIRGEVHPDTLRFSDVAWVLRPGSAVDDAQNTMLMAITQEDAVPAVLQEVRPVLWRPLCRQPFWPKLITLLEFLDNFNLAPSSKSKCTNVLVSPSTVPSIDIHQCCQELAIWAQADTSRRKYGSR